MQRVGSGPLCLIGVRLIARCCQRGLPAFHVDLRNRRIGSGAWKENIERGRIKTEGKRKKRAVDLPRGERV